MPLLEGLRVRRDEEQPRDAYEALYNALKQDKPLRGQAIGVEKDELLGECLVVKIEGPVRGKIPEVEIGTHPWKRLSDLVGQEVVSQIQSIDRHRGVVVLSRKVAQEKEAADTWVLLRKHEGALQEAFSGVRGARGALKDARAGNRADLITALDHLRTVEDRWRQLGPVVLGVVRRVGERGAVVDIGGVMATLHYTEVLPTPVMDCREHLHLGDGIKVRVLHVDSEAGRVMVSRRALLPDPWHDVARNYQEGGLYLGKVARVRERDVIVELEPGVVCRVDRYVMGPAEGAEVVVLVRRIRSEHRWIGGRVIRALQ